MAHHEHVRAARHTHRERLLAEAAEHVLAARVYHDPQATPDARRQARAALLGHAEPLPDPPASEESAPTLKRRR